MDYGNGKDQKQTTGMKTNRPIKLQLHIRLLRQQASVALFARHALSGVLVIGREASYRLNERCNELPG